MDVVTDSTIAADIQPPAHVSAARRMLPGAVMALLVVIGSVLPVFRTANFYFWDDTAGVAVGQWQRIADQLLAGNIPFLQIDMWRGGNFIAEAATGIWNPVMVGLMLITHPFDNMAVAITIAKIAFFVITAFGVYRLTRGYGASRWMAALGGVVLPLSGWALFMDGTSWINGVAITAFTPWAWWAIRRAYLKRGTPLTIVVAIVCGYLLASVGNPYGMVALCAIFLAVAVEAIMNRRIREIWWLIGLGFALLLMSIVIYLPFLLTSSVGFRADSNTYNDEFLSPTLSNLLGMSTPAYKPYIQTFGLPHMTFPGLYLAWFILPMVPWLRWRAVNTHWRSLAGVLAFGALYLVFVLGPTQISMFRWPARLLPFLYLAILVVFVVVASQGLHKDRRTLRTLLSVVAVGAGAWMAYSDMPALWKWIGLTTLVILLLGWLFLRFGDVGGRGFFILSTGILVLLGCQLVFSPANFNVANYNLPTSRQEIQDRFSERYEGLTVQIADWGTLGGKLLDPDKAWQDLLAGDMFAVAGVESTTAYSGIGFTKLDAALCESYSGGMCRDAWASLWKTPRGAVVPLADLLNAQTVVVQKNYVGNTSAPEGWKEVEDSQYAIVYKRVDDLPYPDGRVSNVVGDATVHSDVSHGSNAESLVVSTAAAGDATLTFARLAWPGYSASVNGVDIPIVTNSVGLVQLELPGSLDNASVELRFTPPGLFAGGISFVLGVLLMIGLIVWKRTRLRKTSSNIQTNSFEQAEEK